MSPPPAVLITGASTGIGKASALFLDAQGFRVFAGVRRPEDRSALGRGGSDRLTPVRLDVTDAESIRAVADEIESAVGEAGLQGLVNNAGIVVADVLEFLDLDGLRHQFEVNVMGTAAITKAFLPAIRRGGGRIVQMSSNSGFFSFPFIGPYCASKFALEALSDALRRELRPFGIPVVIIEPGAVDTPIWDKAKPVAQSVKNRLSSEGRERYHRVIDHVESCFEAEARRAIPARNVARVVHRALSTRRPRTRYVVGRDARLGRWLTRWIPDRALDALVARMISRSPKAAEPGTPFTDRPATEPRPPVR